MPKGHMVKTNTKKKTKNQKNKIKQINKSENQTKTTTNHSFRASGIKNWKTHSGNQSSASSENWK